MQVRQVSLCDFRNVARASISFSPGVNVLVGDNAQGKTNLLEAVYLFALGKSFRGAKEAELIRFGAAMTEASLDFTAGGRDMCATLRFSGGRRAVELNRVRLARVSELVGEFRAVLFCPEHLSLIKEGPAVRRSYLDIAVSQLRPLYLRALQRYNVILRERNRLLKTADEQPRVFRETIGLWSAQLCEQAALLAGARAEYVAAVNAAAGAIFGDMTGERERPAFTYLPGFHLEAERALDPGAVKGRLWELLTGNLEREKAAGATLWGVHKDDVLITLNGNSARLYASQGQQRSLALAMKLAEGEICAARTGERPVFLFDDVLSELDATRRAYLTREFAGRQVILTTCERTAAEGLSSARVIEVQDGQYTARDASPEEGEERK